MPAQFEEAVVSTDLLQLQDIRPALCEGVFQRIGRRFKLAAGKGVQGRQRQGFAIDLAIRRQRQMRQWHIGRRQHVFRQLAVQVRAHTVDANGRGRPGEIRHQALVTRHVLTRQDHHVLDARKARQAGFDFTQFDAKAADFHLMVVAPDTFQQAIRRPAAKVAGAVHQGPRVERVVDKLFRGQLRPVQIPLGHAVTTDANLTGHAQRHRLQLRIQHMDLRVGNRPPHGHAVGVIGDRAHFIGAGVSGGFRRPIAMHQAQCGRLRQQAAERRRVATFAAAQQHAQAGQGLGNHLHILVEQRRGDEEHRRPAQRPPESHRVEQCGVVDNLHLAAVQQRAPHVHGARIERWVGGKRHAVGGIEVGVAVVKHQARDAAMRHQYALRRAGGAGGVHDVRHAVRGLRHVRVVARLRVKRQAVQVEAPRRVLDGGIAAGNHPARAAVLHHKALALGGRVDVQRHIGGGAFEDRQLADQQVQRTREQDRHVIGRTHAQAQ